MSEAYESIWIAKRIAPIHVGTYYRNLPQQTNQLFQFWTVTSQVFLRRMLEWFGVASGISSTGYGVWAASKDTLRSPPRNSPWEGPMSKTNIKHFCGVSHDSSQNWCSWTFENLNVVFCKHDTCFYPIFSAFFSLAGPPPNPGPYAMAASSGPLGVVPPKSTHPTSYLGLAPSLWSAVNCSWWHRKTDVFWDAGKKYHVQKECDDYKQLIKDFPSSIFGLWLKLFCWTSFEKHPLTTLDKLRTVQVLLSRSMWQFHTSMKKSSLFTRKNEGLPGTFLQIPHC